MSTKAPLFSILILSTLPMTQVTAATEAPAISREIRGKIMDARQSAIDEEKRLYNEALVQSRSTLPRDARAAVQRRDAPGESAEAKRVAAAQARLDAAVAGVSPEGYMLLAQAKTSDTPPEIIPPSSAKPTPLPPATAAAKPKAGPKPAVIDAEASYIDSANSITVFEGSVSAKHPDFDLTCDKLEVHMPKTEKKDRPGPALAGGSKLDSIKSPPQGETATPPPAVDTPGQTGGIDKVIATGTRVVITQHAPDGSSKIGTGRHVTYDGKTGDITLRGMPQIQDGGNMIIATAAETVLVITAAGKIKTMGPHQTKFTQAQQPVGKDKPKAPSNPVPVSGPGILPVPVSR